MKKIFLKFTPVFIFLLTVNNVFASSIDVLKVTREKKYQIPILVYHSFGPAHSKKETSVQAHYRITASVFDEQMKYLLKNEYHPISFTTYLDSFKNNIKLPDKAIVLTFDDGWVSQYKYAVPILEKFKFTGTFFIITNYTNNNYKAYMNWDNLKDLVVHNFDIESHSKSHPVLNKINSKELFEELIGSKKILENKLAIKVNAVAYPDYAQNEIVREAVKSAGYTGARDGNASFNNSIDYIYQLKSQEVVNNPNPFSNKRMPDLP
jgi:peptidoglycan/xylan/chitin deacetylase (PgdA/CDA1 family)